MNDNWKLEKINNSEDAYVLKIILIEMENVYLEQALQNKPNKLQLLLPGEHLQL